MLLLFLDIGCTTCSTSSSVVAFVAFAAAATTSRSIQVRTKDVSSNVGNYGLVVGLVGVIGKLVAKDSVALMFP